MKTEWQVRDENKIAHPLALWMTDAKHLQDCFNCNGNTLWRRESETLEEAAVRRMAALDKWAGNSLVSFNARAESLSQFADRLSPPPPTTETQVDWQTLEPIKEVPVWHLPSHKIWVAGVNGIEWDRDTISQSFHRLLGGFCAIGSTRETALRNLQELQNNRT